MTIEDFEAQVVSRLSVDRRTWSVLGWYKNNALVVSHATIQFSDVFPKTVEGAVEAAAFIEGTQAIHGVLTA